MQITIIFIGILFIVGLVFFGMKLNNYSEEKYDYRPINIFNAGIMMTPFILGTNLQMGFFPYVVYNFLKLLIGSPRNHF